EAENPPARGPIDPVHVEQDHEAALRLGQRGDRSAEPRAELGLLQMPLRSALVARAFRERGLVVDEPRPAAQPLEAQIADYREQPFARPLDAPALLPVSEVGLLADVLGLVTILQQRLRDAIDDRAVLQHGQLESPRRHWPLAFARGHRLWLDRAGLCGFDVWHSTRSLYGVWRKDALDRPRLHEAFISPPRRIRGETGGRSKCALSRRKSPAVTCGRLNRLEIDEYRRRPARGSGSATRHGAIAGRADSGHPQPARRLRARHRRRRPFPHADARRDLR